MPDIPDAVAAKVLADCARRCCICRKSKPLRLQVHHIVERANGGTNDPDNLIALCLTCHTDVHTNAPFTRRFSLVELKMHRDNLYKLVAEGKMSSNDEEVPLQYATSKPIARSGSPDLMPEAITLLLDLAKGEGIMANPSVLHSPSTGFDRAAATGQEAFDQLVKRRFLRHHDGILYVLTLAGYNAADEYLALINEKPT
jgi:hypothetical protein